MEGVKGQSCRAERRGKGGVMGIGEKSEEKIRVGGRDPNEGTLERKALGMKDWRLRKADDTER